MEYLILLVLIIMGVGFSRDVLAMMRKLNQISDKVDRLECGVKEGEDEQ